MNMDALKDIFNLLSFILVNCYYRYGPLILFDEDYLNDVITLFIIYIPYRLVNVFMHYIVAFRICYLMLRFPLSH